MSGRLLFGEWLSVKLRQKGWTKAAFANLVGVAPSTVSEWINGRNRPRWRVTEAIADALEVDVNEVLIRAGYPPITPGYRLSEEPAKEPEEIDLEDPRLRFFAAKSGKLTDEEWDIIKRIIQTWTEDE